MHVFNESKNPMKTAFTDFLQCSFAAVVTHGAVPLNPRWPGTQNPTNERIKIHRTPKMAPFCHQNIDKMSPFTRMAPK